MCRPNFQSVARGVAIVLYYVVIYVVAKFTSERFGIGNDGNLILPLFVIVFGIAAVTVGLYRMCFRASSDPWPKWISFGPIFCGFMLIFIGLFEAFMTAAGLSWS